MTKKTNTVTNIATDTRNNNNNKSSFKQAANISPFKGSFILSAFLYALALTGCGNASQSATSTYTSKSNTVDSVLQEQIAKSKVENGADGIDSGNTAMDGNSTGNDSNPNDSTFITSDGSQITDVYGNAADRAEYETDSTEIDITLSADEKYSVLGNNGSEDGSNSINGYTSSSDSSNSFIGASGGSNAPGTSGGSSDSGANAYIQNDNASDVANKTSAKSDSSVTYDLSVMGADMVYATVYDLVTNYDSHVDDTYKIKGNFYSSVDPETRNRYYFCVISDALGCCSQGLEFTLNDNAKYPEDYPAEGSEVVLKGTWSPYKDPATGQEFYALLDSTVLEIY